jgi:uncharacterized membrane protein
MAGVGFSLRSIRSEDSYTGLLRLYGAAGIISSGPWLISILTLLVIGVLGQSLVPDSVMLTRFQVSVTWLFAASLVLSGPLQLAFTRYIADRSYLDEDDATPPSLLGALAVTSALAALTSLALSPLFADESLTLRVLLSLGLVTLCDTWMVLVVLTGLREHTQVLWSFALGYGIAFAGTLVLAPFGTEGMLAGFVAGQGALLGRSLYVVMKRMPSRSPVELGFLDYRKIHWELLLIGLFYNLGIWADKLLFWLKPDVSRAVLGPLRASEVYDLPIFLAYLTIVPGMAVFLVRVETDFAERHHAFYAAIREGASLRRIEPLCTAMTASARRAVADIAKIQGLTLALCFAFGPQMLKFFGISELHLPLFYVDAVGVSLQVLLLAVTSMFFYLDRKREVVWLSLLLLVSNAALTWASQQLGPELYGYGFAIAMCVTSVIALAQLSSAFRSLVRDTFMLQPVVAS